MRQLVYYIATSLDGFIADPTGDFSAFPQDPETLARLFERYPETCPAHVRAALGVSAPNRRFDTVLMGRRTFQPALDAGLTEGAYPHLRQLVVTRGGLASGPESSVETLSNDLPTAVAALKEQPGRDIWLCGGADVAGQLVDQIDEIQLKINPVLLGRGIPLFSGVDGARHFDLIASETLPGGIQLATFDRA